MEERLPALRPGSQLRAGRPTLRLARLHHPVTVLGPGAANWSAMPAGHGALRDAIVAQVSFERRIRIRYGDTLVLRPVVSHWGSSSCDVTIAAAVDERAAFVCTLTCGAAGGHTG